MDGDRTDDAAEESSKVIGNASLAQQFKPSYPRSARARGMEGTVMLSLRISDKGRVMAAQVAQSSGHKVLDEAALRSIWKATFKPAQTEDGPVEATINLPIVFRLND